MDVPARCETRLALLEAELLYLCADLGGDVLARAIGAIETLRADNGCGPDGAPSVDLTTVLAYPRQVVALDANG